MMNEIKDKSIQKICTSINWLYGRYIWFKKQEISFLIYIIIFVLLFIGGLFISDKTSQLYFVFNSLLIFLVLFGVVLDTVNVLLKYKSTNWGVLLLLFTSILLYFVNIQSETIAHSVIASITGEKAQYFPEVSSYFEAIFIPLAFLIILIKNSTYIVLMIVIAYIVVLLGIVIVIKNKWNKTFFHVLFYVTAMFSIITMFGSDNEKVYDSFFGTNYIPKKIVEYSYHKNTSCEGIGDVYINFLYKDIISVSNVKEINYGSNEAELEHMSRDDQNITFSTLTCKKKKIVSKGNIKD